MAAWESPWSNGVITHIILPESGVGFYFLYRCSHPIQPPFMSKVVDCFPASILPLSTRYPPSPAPQLITKTGILGMILYPEFPRWELPRGQKRGCWKLGPGWEMALNWEKGWGDGQQKPSLLLPSGFLLAVLCRTLIHINSPWINKSFLVIYV